MIPVVIYGAKSTEDPRGSIGTQLDDCRAAIERNGDREVVGTFSDEAKSAYHGARGDGLAQAKEAASAASASSGEAELWVQHTDRLARGDAVIAPHLVEVILWARKAGVQVRSVQDDATGENVLMAAIMGERNYEDSRRKGEAVKSGMQRRKARGLHNGGPRKYGWEYVRDDHGRTVSDEPRRIVPAEAVVIERICREYVNGTSQQAIVRGLNRDGVKSATGKSWYQGTVRKILTDRNEGIVSPELWARVSARLEAQTRAPGNGRGRPPAGGHIFTWGMLRCGRCGGAMIPQTVQRKSPTGKPWGKRYEAYRCLTRIRHPEACNQEPVGRALIDGAVLDYFNEQVLDVEATRRQIEQAAERQTADLTVLRAQAEREQMQASDRLARVRRAFQDGKIEPDDWAEQRTELTAEYEAAAARVRALEEQASRVADAAQVDAEAELLRDLAALRSAIVGDVRDAGSVDALRAALLRIFDGFTLVRDPLLGTYEVEPRIREEAAPMLPAGCLHQPRPARTGLGFDGTHGVNEWPSP